MEESSLKDIIQLVKENADIVGVIGQYVPLKKAGSRWLGVCPFHHDRRPSMNVTPQMGIYKCFACGAGGDVIRFVQDYEKLAFIDALRAVAQRCNIIVPEKFASDSGAREKTESVLAANQLTAQYYLEQLDKQPEVLAYLEKRGVKAETRRHFQLGYAPENLEGLIRRATAKQVAIEALIEAGVVGESQTGRRYDRFGGRLIFPIWNLSGHVIGFGGRTLDPQGQPKYVNSPDSPLYHKSRVLYGFNFSRGEIDKAAEVVLVEGYMDLLTLWQAGIKNAVAVSGTALTKDHVQILGRFAKRAVLFFDGDAAGRKAVRRSLEMLLEQGIEAKVPVLPAQEDPDSFTQAKGAEAVRALFAESDDLPGFILRDAGVSPEAMSPEAKDSVLKEAAALVAHIPSEVVRSGHLETLRRNLGVSAIAIRAAVQGQPGLQATPGKSARAFGQVGITRGGVPGLLLPEANFKPRDEAVAEWQLLQLMLGSALIANQALEAVDLDWLTDPVARDLMDYALALQAETGVLEIRALQERLPEGLREILPMVEFLPTEVDAEIQERRMRQFADILRALELAYVRRQMAQSKDLKSQMELQKRVKDLVNRKPGGQP